MVILLMMVLMNLLQAKDEKRLRRARGVFGRKKEAGT